VSDLVPPAVYGLCALTSLVCMLLLWRSYRSGHQRLLLLLGLCFAGLAVNNVLLFVDFTVLAEVDLSWVRGVVGLAAVAALLFSLIWEGL
jgi:Family of unknown function (DUF5985)